MFLGRQSVFLRPAEPRFHPRLSLARRSPEFCKAAPCLWPYPALFQGKIAAPLPSGCFSRRRTPPQQINFAVLTEAASRVDDLGLMHTCASGALFALRPGSV